MSKEPTQFSEIVNEGSVAVYTCNLVDELDQAIGSGVIDALTLTLSNVDDASIVNARNEVNALNANDVTVTAGGLLTFTLQPLDTSIVDNTKDSETRRATFKAQFNTVSFMNWDVDFTIRNLSQVA